MTWLAICLVLAQAFWQSKPPADWNDIELARFLSDSPWAQTATSANKAGAIPVQVYLATAGPIRTAVAERNRRLTLRHPVSPKADAGVTPHEDSLHEEFQAWFNDNQAQHIILAARVGNNNAFTSESEMRHVQQDCVLDLGRLKVKMSSYFPPTSSDPYLYLAFPRGPVSPADKSVAFEIYLPGVSSPFRTVQFKTKDMLVDGKLEL